MSDEAAQKSLHRKSLWWNLYIKFGLLLIIGLIGLAMCLALSNADFSSHTGLYDVWVNGVYTGRHTLTRDNGVGAIILLCVALGAIGGLIYYMAKCKRVVAFEDCYQPMREASRRRKRVFAIAVLFGWCGIDRFAMKRWFMGFVKLLLGLCTALSIYLIGEGVRVPASFSLVMLAFTLYWWILDLLLIWTGAARTRGREYLR